MPIGGGAMTSALPLFLDVELGRDGALHGLGAIGPRGEEAVAERAADVPAVLRQVASWGADLLVGHNLADHDRPWLARYQPGHPTLRLPWVDTLVLSPLAFPQRPYHRLLKEERLVRESRPLPLADCRSTRTLLRDEQAAFARMDGERLEFLRAALTSPDVPGSNAGYGAVLGAPTLTLAAAWAQLVRSLDGKACSEALAALPLDPQLALPLAFVASWLSVPPGSTIPAWARVRFPPTQPLLERLRRPSCGRCEWCESQTAPGWLARMFGYPAFRPTPTSASGGSLQQEIVEAGMRELPLYAILPTGTGKSACFQIPAAARHRATGALTVVISPLQSLMKDQVEQLLHRDPHATTVNGSLTPLERKRALEEVREGYTSMVYVSPEQLRSPGVARVLKARTIGAWVVDEAHCLTDWGHDFRTDYLYVPRFARELAAGQGVPCPPFQCYTGTSQLAVTQALVALFRAEVGQDLMVFDGGAERENLTFAVESCPEPQKVGRMLELLEAALPEAGEGAAIVFCATRADADRMATLLKASGWPAAAYHAGLDSQARRDVQDRFMQKGLRVIAATSAFGMGVDKADVRLVVHLEMPSSLEAYLQQAGRAGRDGEPASCVLLFQPEDQDRQFRMASLGALTVRDLKALWRSLLRVPARRVEEDEVRVVTRGELARMDPTAGLFPPDDPASETRITTGIAWLERAGFLERNENLTSVFQGRPRLPTLAASLARMDELDLAPPKKREWSWLLKQLYDAPVDRTLSADDLTSGTEDGDPVGAGTRVLAELKGMVEAGLVASSTRMSAFVGRAVANSTRVRMQRLVDAQSALLAALPELSGADDPHTPWVASLPRLATYLRDNQTVEVRPERVGLLLRALRHDGKGLSDQEASLDIRTVSPHELSVTLRRPWTEVARLGRLRTRAIERVVDFLEELAAKTGDRGDNVLVDFDFESLAGHVDQDLFLRGQLRSSAALTEQTLLLLHDTRVLVLQGGLAVFRQAMSIRRRRGELRRPQREDVAPLMQHQDQRKTQVHVVGEYARLGTQDMARARQLSRDWFTVPQATFVERWFPRRKAALQRATSEAAYTSIVGPLDDAQLKVVSASAGQNLLVLAGPGSGKTRVLVHRVAWLVRVKRVRAQGILVVCYTRANAQELRARLRALIGDDARGVTVSTVHGLALRLVPRDVEANPDFDGLLGEALAVLQGTGVGETADVTEVRDLLLRGATHLLVDEYQDLDEAQVRFLEALAGRAHADPDQRLAMMAVGDDDQSIFEWRQGSSRWIREFAAAWGAETIRLTHCYRCSRPILEAGASLVRPIPERLKAEVALEPAGEGPPVRRWIVPADQIARVVRELVGGTGGAVGDGGGREIAVLARTRAALAPIRFALEEAGVSVEWPLPHAERIPLPRVREVVRLLRGLDARGAAMMTAEDLAPLIPSGPGPWVTFLRRWHEELQQGLEGHDVPAAAVRRSLWEALVTERGEHTLGNGVRLGTLHGAKGLEWPHVILVDPGDSGASDADRRLWYVGATRARHQLDLVLGSERVSPLLGDLGERHPPRSTAPPTPPRPAYELLNLDDLWIDALGRRASAPGHALLERLPFGAPVRLQHAGGRLSLVAEGVEIAVVKRAAAQQWAYRDASLKLVAVVERTVEQSEPAYRPELQVDRWWVPICEAMVPDGARSHRHSVR